MNAEVDFDHQAEVVFFRFLHRKITVFPFSYCTFLEGSQYAQPTTKEQGVMLKMEYYINYLEFLCTGDLSILLHLCIQLFIYIRRTHGFLFYTLGYNLILLQLLCSSNCSSPDPCELFSVGSCATLRYPHPVFFFWNFLTF